MKNKKNTLTILIIIILLLSLLLGAYFIISTQNKDEDIEILPQEVDSIEGYEYKLEDRDTTLYKDIFAELKSVLESEEIDYSNYAELLSELYIIDLYTINNKVSKYDVGGYEFILPDSRDNYSLKVENTLYKYVEDNSNGKRVQTLPEVKSIEIIETKESKFNVKENEYDGFSIELQWDYVDDLDYDTNAVVNLIETDNRLYVF